MYDLSKNVRSLTLERTLHSLSQKENVVHDVRTWQNILGNYKGDEICCPWRA